MVVVVAAGVAAPCVKIFQRLDVRGYTISRVVPCTALRIGSNSIAPGFTFACWLLLLYLFSGAAVRQYQEHGNTHSVHSINHYGRPSETLLLEEEKPKRRMEGRKRVQHVAAYSQMFHMLFILSSCKLRKSGPTAAEYAALFRAQGSLLGGVRVVWEVVFL